MSQELLLDSNTVRQIVDFAWVAVLWCYISTRHTKLIWHNNITSPHHGTTHNVLCLYHHFTGLKYLDVTDVDRFLKTGKGFCESVALLLHKTQQIMHHFGTP